jgi:hypothetical protein
MRVLEQVRLEKESRELFHPVTNESMWMFSPLDGETLARDAPSHVSVIEELLAKGEEYKQRREQRAEALRKNVESFTFKPQTNPNSRKIIVERATQRLSELIEARESSAQRPSGALEGVEEKRTPKFDVDIFVSRMQRHAAEKARRIAEVRHQTKIAEVAECTFRPQIHVDPVEIDAKAESTARRRHKKPVVSSPSPSPHPLSSGRHAAKPHHTERTHKQWDRELSEAAAPNDSENYLEHLEEELRGVIAEWTTID